MKIKVAIFENYGYNYCPNWVLEKIDKNKNFRISLAKLLCEFEINSFANSLTNENFSNVFEKLKSGKIDYIKFDDEFVWFCDLGSKLSSKIRIVEVDTSKPWRINDYDGAESIEYFDGIKCIDEEINMCQW